MMGQWIDNAFHESRCEENLIFRYCNFINVNVITLLVEKVTANNSSNVKVILLYLCQ